MGNVPKFNQAIKPSIDDIKLVLGKHPIFGAEDPVDSSADPNKKLDPVEQGNPFEQKYNDLVASQAEKDAELKKYKDAEEEALRKNNTDLENFKKDVDKLTLERDTEKSRGDSMAQLLENEILINKILENGTFKKEAIKFVVQELDREKVKVDLQTRTVTNLDNALKKISESFPMFVGDSSGNNGVTPGGAGNGGGNNGANQNGNPWTRAGSPPAPPTTQSEEAAQRNSMVGRYSALRSGR